MPAGACHRAALCADPLAGKDKSSLLAGPVHYCGSSPDSFTTARATSRSAAIAAANCSGVLSAGTWPRLMMYLSRKAGSLTTRVTSAAIRSMTGFGVPADR